MLHNHHTNKESKLKANYPCKLTQLSKEVACQGGNQVSHWIKGPHNLTMYLPKDKSSQFGKELHATLSSKKFIALQNFHGERLQTLKPIGLGCSLQQGVYIQISPHKIISLVLSINTPFQYFISSSKEIVSNFHDTIMDQIYHRQFVENMSLNNESYHICITPTNATLLDILHCEKRIYRSSFCTVQAFKLSMKQG